MSEIHCPVCDRPNDENAERCWYCQAALHPVDSPAGDNTGDWLDGLRSESDSPAPDLPADDPAASPEGSDEEVPEWLARIRERARSEKEPSEPMESQEKSSALSGPSEFDRLGELTSKEEEPSGQEKNPTPESSSKQDEEEWLKQISTGQQASDEANKPASASSAPAGEAAPSGTSESPLEGSTAHSKETSNSEGNNWLSSYKKLSDQEELSGQVMPAHSEEKQSKAPFNGASFKDWLGETHEEEEKAASPSEEPQTSGPSEESAGPSQKPGTSDVKAFDDRSLYDWIEKTENEELASQEGIPDNQKLEPAALPAWLQALRPGKKETPPKAAPAAKPAYREDKGPLAGIEGVLQGEELNQYYSKPQLYSGSLIVNESQLERSKILKSIADQEQWMDEGVEKKPNSFRWLLRLLVAVLMLAAVIVPDLMSGLPQVAPSLYSQPVVATYNTVNALTPGKPVLIAADFDSSLYGEMDWSMQALLSHLLKRNIPIAYLSTNSVGATLMSQSLEKALQIYPGYPVIQVVNLGYLPGGSIGLQSLAQDPRTAMPLTADLRSAWDSNSPLQTVSKLSDFSAVVVITENPDTVRYWIEQINNSLGSTPMLAVVSAQAAPLVAPYYNSGQIDGYLSGLYPAAAYESMLGISQPALGHLTSYQAVMLLVVLMLIIGGVVSLIMYRPASDKKKGGQS